MAVSMTEISEQESFILIKFDHPGSALFEVYYNKVTPGQVFACLPFLEVRAKNEVLTKDNEKSARVLRPKSGLVLPE